MKPCIASARAPPRRSQSAGWHFRVVRTSRERIHFEIEIEMRGRIALGATRPSAGNEGPGTGRRRPGPPTGPRATLTGHYWVNAVVIAPIAPASRLSTEPLQHPPAGAGQR